MNYKDVSQKYSLESFANLYGLSVDEFIESVKNHVKYKNDLIQKYKNKGFTDRQATNIVIGILYVPNFSNSNFSNYNLY